MTEQVIEDLAYRIIKAIYNTTKVQPHPDHMLKVKKMIREALLQEIVGAINQADGAS